MRPVSDYQTIAFDCDGVILNSNHIKTNAFFEVALPYGTDAAKALQDYHVYHGGISRNLKFQYFFSDILQRDASPGELETLVEHYGEHVSKELLEADVTPSLDDFYQQTKHANWVVISGGNEVELRSLFCRRHLDHLFPVDKIFGSPRSKTEIVQDEEKRGHFVPPVLFLGDSKYDYDVAQQHGFDFVFVRAWSEWPNPELTDNVTVVDYVANLTKNTAETQNG